MEKNKKPAPPKINHTYSLPDRNVYGDTTQTGRDSTSCGLIAFLGVFRTYFMAEVGGYRFFGFCSDLDQNRAVLWSKSEMKHLKHPKHLKHLKHLLWMLGLLFCQHFKELSGKVKDGVHRGQDQ